MNSKTSQNGAQELYLKHLVSKKSFLMITSGKRLQMIAENKSSPGTQWATQPPFSDCKVDLIFFLSFGTIHHPYLKQSTRVHLRNWSIKEGDLFLFLVLSRDETIFTCPPSTFSSFPQCHWQRFIWVFPC